MACCLLERFCCCCTLRTGSLVIATIGWISMLGQIFALSVGSIVNSDHSSQNKVEIGYRISGSIVSLFITCLLVCGILKKKPYCFLPWLITTCIGCFASSIGSVICFVMIFVMQDIAGIMTAVSIGLALFSALYWYFWACVYSYYREVKGAAEGNSGNVY